MSDRKRGDAISISRDLLPRLELGELEFEVDAADGAHHDCHELPEPSGAVNMERFLPRAQVEGLEQAGQTEPMVGVIVGEEEIREVGQADRGDELPLGPLAAVK